MTPPIIAPLLVPDLALLKVETDEDVAMGGVDVVKVEVDKGTEAVDVSPVVSLTTCEEIG